MILAFTLKCWHCQTPGYNNLDALKDMPCVTAEWDPTWDDKTALENGFTSKDCESENSGCAKIKFSKSQI